MKKDTKALFMIQQSISENIFPRITKATWEILQKEFQENNKVIFGKPLTNKKLFM